MEDFSLDFSLTYIIDGLYYELWDASVRLFRWLNVLSITSAGFNDGNVCGVSIRSLSDFDLLELRCIIYRLSQGFLLSFQSLSEPGAGCEGGYARLLHSIMHFVNYQYNGNNYAAVKEG